MKIKLTRAIWVNNKFILNTLILILFLAAVSDAVTIRGEIGDPTSFGVKIIEIQGESSSRYQPGKWIAVKFDADYIPFELKKGMCVEIKGAWTSTDHLSLTDRMKKIECYQPHSKCSAGPIGPPQCSGQSLKQLYQDANCNQKWQVIDDCSSHGPSECCKNDACERCEEQRPKCSAGPIGPPQCSGGSAKQLYLDANCNQKWQIIDDCSRYTPSKCCKDGSCENCEEQTPPPQPNEPPVISDLSADKKSPQAPEMQIRWNAIALDPDNDQIYYKFMVSGPGTGNQWEDMTGWIDSNAWTWIPTASDIGENSVGAFVRDGKHASEDDYDNYAGKYFVIEAANKPPIVLNISSDLKSPQQEGKSINWTAIAADPENDQVYYKFMASGLGTSNEWKEMTSWAGTNTWIWIPTISDIGENSVGVFVRDGRHASEDDYDDYKGEYFVIEQGNTAPVIENLSADFKSPQQVGRSINWIALASDADNDTIYYKFMVSGPGTNNTLKDMSGWITSNAWVWTPATFDIGENSIGVFVRDGKHAAEDDYDNYTGEYFSIVKSEHEAECESPVKFQGEVISEHDYSGRIPTLEIRINKFLSEQTLETSIIEVERPSLTDQTIEMGDCVEVIGCPIKGTEDINYAGGWLIGRASKTFSVKEISCEDKVCGKILDYSISNGQNYPKGQIILSDLKYKSNLNSEVDFKGVLLVKSPTGQIYSNYKNQRTAPNQEDSFGNNKGNAIDLKIPENAPLGSYSTKLELRRYDTDEICDETDWQQDQFAIGSRCVIQGRVIERTRKDNEMLFKLEITKIDCLNSFAYKVGDIINVYYNKYEGIGECVEVEGAFDPGVYGDKIHFFASKAPKTVTCPSESSKRPQCTSGTIGNPECFGNIAKQIYQSENCDQEWRIVEDCAIYDPSKCCNNGRCENCGEGPKPSEECKDVTFQGIVNNVGDITWDCKDWTGGGIATLWEITVDNIEGPPLSSRVIKVSSEDLNCNSADTRAIKGSVNEKIAKGDFVEVFGCYNETESSVTLSGKREYYIKIINGCKGFISGYVYDAGAIGKNVPIANAKLYCEESKEFATTDEFGHFIFLISSCPSKEYHIFCEATNYILLYKNIMTDLSGNAEINLELYRGPQTDSDADGLSDDLERIIGTKANDPDSDDDELMDGEEFNGRDISKMEVEIYGENNNKKYYTIEEIIKWDSFSSDYDGNGISNCGNIAECLHNLFYISPTLVKTDPLSKDTDGDCVNDKEDPFPTKLTTKWEICIKGVENVYEVQKYKSNDRSVKQALGKWYYYGVRFDTVVPVGEKNVNPEGSSYLVRDFDLDGISDYVEQHIIGTQPGIELINENAVNPSFELNSDAADSDCDGISDLDEIFKGTNPTFDAKNACQRDAKVMLFGALSVPISKIPIPKNLVSILGKEMDIPLGATIYMDYDDLVQVSKDGKAGWVTIWIAASGGPSISLVSGTPEYADAGIALEPLERGMTKETDQPIEAGCDFQFSFIGTDGFHINPSLGISCGTQIIGPLDIKLNLLTDSGMIKSLGQPISIQSLISGKYLENIKVADIRDGSINGG